MAASEVVTDGTFPVADWRSAAPTSISAIGVLPVRKSKTVGSISHSALRHSRRKSKTTTLRTIKSQMAPIGSSKGAKHCFIMTALAGLKVDQSKAKCRNPPNVPLPSKQHSPFPFLFDHNWLCLSRLGHGAARTAGVIGLVVRKGRRIRTSDHSPRFADCEHWLRRGGAWSVVFHFRFLAVHNVFQNDKTSVAGTVALPAPSRDRHEDSSKRRAS